MTDPDYKQIALWSGADSDTAMELAVELYGKEAVTAAAWCAFAAWSECRQEDYRFWFDIFKRLTGAGHA